MRIPEYPWLRLVGLRPGRGIDPWLNGEGAVVIGMCTGGRVVPVVAPDNAYNTLDLSAMKIPDGYEIDGASAVEAFVDARDCEWVLSDSGHAIRAAGNSWHGVGDMRRIRLRKIEPKTQTWVIGESCDPEMVALAKSRAFGLSPRVTYRFEERPVGGK